MKSYEDKEGPKQIAMMNQIKNGNIKLLGYPINKAISRFLF